MIQTSIFRVASYSASTSHIAAHVERAARLHKFLHEEGVSVEPMVEATGSVLRCYLDEEGRMQLDVEPAVITFVADATPAMLQPLLQQWFESEGPSGTAAQHEENQQNRNGDAQEPQGGPAPSPGTGLVV